MISDQTNTFFFPNLVEIVKKSDEIFSNCFFFTMKLIFVRIKIPYPLQWGAPTFDAGHAFGMMAATLVSLIEVIL